MRLFGLGFLAAACFLVGCTNDTPEEGKWSANLKQEWITAILDQGGRASLQISIPPGAATFQLAAFFQSGTATLTSLTNPSGEEVVGASSESTTQHVSSVPHVTNFPFLGGAVPGGMYTAVYKVTPAPKGPSVGGTEIRVLVTSKNDSDLRNGNLRVNLVTVGPVAGSSDTQGSLDNALEIWRTVYERGGILLDAQWYQFDGPATLPDPRAGNSLYEQISGNTRPDAVNVIFGEKVEGLRAPFDRFGLAGVVPGPATTTANGVVVLSILALTGQDGKFDYGGEGSTEVHNDETRLAAEEMGRLTARYLGLENIVQFSGSTVLAVDSLSDTETCYSYVSCRENSGARGNLMFPYPLNKTRNPENDRFENSREYYPRDIITEQQSLALNRHVLAD